MKFPKDSTIKLKSIVLLKDEKDAIPAGYTARVVEMLGREQYLIECAMPDTDLVGGYHYITAVVTGDEIELKRNKSDGAVRDRPSAEVVKGGLYKHFKGGEYIVRDVAQDSESGEPMWVVYYSKETGEAWVSSYSDFIANITRQNYSGPRFDYVGDESVRCDHTFQEKQCDLKVGHDGNHVSRARSWGE